MTGHLIRSNIPKIQPSSTLIICAEFFANGLKITGLIDALIVHAQNLGLGLNGMTVVLTGVVGIVSVLTDSGVGAFSSFAALAPDVASGLGGSAASFVNPMQLSCGIMRSISPVAGAMIAMAGAVGVTPVALIRRTFIPMMAGFVAVYCLTSFSLVKQQKEWETVNSDVCYEFTVILCFSRF